MATKFAVTVFSRVLTAVTRVEVEEIVVVVATVREEQAIGQVTDRLVRDFATTHSAEQVHSAVRRARAEFQGHPVRQFVPILVERVVRRSLAHPETGAAGGVTADSADATPVLSKGGDNASASHARAADTDSTATSRGATSSAATPRAVAPKAERPAATAESVDADTAAASDPRADTIGDDQPARKSSSPNKSRAGKHASDTESEGVGATVAALWSGNRRYALAGAALLLVIIVVAVGFGMREPAADTTAAPAQQPLTVVHGMVGSEKMPFFQDQAVVDALARNGLKVDAQPAGSRQIATSPELGTADFAFPSSEVTAERIQRDHNVRTRYIPFSSPMAVATFAPIADLLTKAGVVRPGPVPTFDLGAYLQLVGNNTRWDQLPDNTAYAVGKNILVSTTDPRSSNSAAMYLAAASYVANNQIIVQGAEAEQNVLPTVSRLFVGQGYTESSSEGPFGNYLAGGMGPTPMAWIYESQFVDAAVHGKTTPEMRMLYPSPTLWSRHTLVPLNDDGDRLGRLLSQDPELQRLAAEHGFRTSDPNQFGKVVAEHSVPVAPDLIDVVAPPTYDTLEHLLDGVARSYN